MNDNTESIKKQIVNYRRRLNLLEEIRAYKGRNADPEIIMEIEDVQKEIVKLESSLPRKSLAEIILDENPQHFSSEKIDDTRRVVAALLDISENQVRISFARVGSVVLLVQMPEKALDKLIQLQASEAVQTRWNQILHFFKPNSVLQKLQVKQVRKISDLSYANLASVNLSRFDLFNMDMSWANLSKANLTEANLIGANLVNADLDSANLTKADLTGCDLSYADLNKAILYKATLSYAECSSANFGKTVLHGAKLDEADLSNTILRRSVLKKAILNLTDLTKADLSEANLRGAFLRKANMSSANLLTHLTQSRI